MVNLAAHAGAQSRTSAAASPCRYYVLAILTGQIAAAQGERKQPASERNHFGEPVKPL